ncbi:MAG: RnfABCDGE type electron transport complex subunit B [Clostridia bacterium]|nr:RnfABCDGE type electron transport complex subunit B [Clostridia bacterium]
MLAIQISGILIPAAILLAVAALFALVIVVLSRKLSVEENEREKEVLSHLAGANCGACGYPGCSGFAKALCEGKAQLSDCSATPKEGKQEIGKILGVAADGEDTVAVVRCNGGSHCQSKYEYQGYGDCRTAELLAGGRKACPVGCIGLGTCTDVCPNYAIDVGEEGFAVVDREKCTSCGLCIRNCPKKLIDRIPRSARVYIACSNDCRGKDVKELCSSGCLGCTLCSKVCESGAITMKNNLPVFDYSKCTGCLKCVEKCPVHCIKEVKE